MDDNEKAAMAAARYAAEHKVAEIIEDAFEGLIRDRPEEPLKFLQQRFAAGLTNDGGEEEPADAKCTEQEAIAYLDEQRLPQLLEELMGCVLFDKPADAGEYLAERVGSIPAKPEFITDGDLQGVFSLFDPTGRGSVSGEQLRTAARVLGLAPAEGEEAAAAPGGAGGVDQEAFVTHLRGLIDAKRIL